MGAAQTFVNFIVAIALCRPVPFKSRRSDVLGKVGLKLFQSKGHFQFLLEVDVLPSLPLIETAAIPQLLGSVLVELRCGFQHFGRLHHAVVKIHLRGRRLLLLGYAYHNRTEQIVRYRLPSTVSATQTQGRHLRETQLRHHCFEDALELLDLRQESAENFELYWVEGGLDVVHLTLYRHCFLLFLEKSSKLYG